jgi:hypothetical protein
MATEKDLELLDDYLSNRMKGQEKIDFEKRLESDASLQHELGLQKGFIEGIKKARVAELKAMLSEIAIPAPSNSSLMIKAALTAVVVAVVGTGLYFLVNKDEVEVSPQVDTEETLAVQPTPQEETAPIEKTEEVVPQEQEVAPDQSATKNTPGKKTDTENEREENALKQPTVAPYDPTKELEDGGEKPEVVEENNTPSISTSSIAVITDDTDKKLNFHYQFKDGKLFLLGSFEKDLYEILEFFRNNQRTIFLYYNSNYYLLDEAQSQPTPLKAITDPTLLQRLKDSRGK